MPTITCPHCAFSRDLPADAIPPGVTAATCPKCRQRFSLADQTWSAPAPETVVSAHPVHSPSAVTPVNTSTDSGCLEQRLRFSFTGTAREYFGIWIVNTLLKIVTLGIYSAWAKVRKRRYFYGSTHLGGASFDYLADPKILFRGWLLAVFFFLSYTIAGKVDPQAGSLLGLVFYGALPWLIVRSRAFNLRNTDHRNIRFTFTPDYREAYVVFAGIPVLLPFTLGLIFPYMVYRQKKFFVENSGFGRTRFSFDSGPAAFYLLFLKAIGWFVLIAVALFASIGIFSATLTGFLPLFRDIDDVVNNRSLNVTAAVFIAALLSFALLYLFFAIFIRTALANLVWNSTRIRRSRFVSSLRVRDMAWLYLSGAAAILFSAGLLAPWASIRIARYKLERLELFLADDPGSFLGWGHQSVGPAGEEIGDMFGIDIGL